jgi:hypothetical protein
MRTMTATADGGETERDGGARTMDDDDDASCG